jgi:hypothetical protein
MIMPLMLLCVPLLIIMMADALADEPPLPVTAAAVVA